MTKTALAAVVILFLAGCNHTPVSPSTLPSLRIEDLVSSVSAGTSQGTSKPGQAPLSATGPIVTVAGNSAFINGGTLPVALTSGSPFNTIYVVVAAQTAGLFSQAAGGIDGYYDIRLPSSQTSVTALLAFPQTTLLSALTLQFAVADSTGQPGPYVGLTTTAIQVGTGDIQVSLAWDVDSDLDLHVVEPNGEEIYYGNRRSASGGQLDLDSNAACTLDHERNENITWPVGQAPRGTYTVRVDNWSSCQVTQTNYTVRINSGGSTQIVTGSFTGPGDDGGRGSGRLIATFEHVTGPVALTTGGLLDGVINGPDRVKIRAPRVPAKP